MTFVRATLRRLQGILWIGLVVLSLSMVDASSAQSGQSAPSSTHQSTSEKSLGLPSTQPASPQNRTLGNPASSGGIVKTIFSLTAVIAVMVCLAVALKAVSRKSGGIAAKLGAGGSAPSGLLEILGRYPVGRRQQLVLMRMHSRVLLLSQTLPGRAAPGGFATLAELTDPDEVAAILKIANDADATSSRASFSRSLSEAFDGDTQSQYVSEDLSTPDTSFGVPVEQLLQDEAHTRTSDQAHPLRKTLAAMSDVVSTSVRSKFPSQNRA